MSVTSYKDLSVCIITRDQREKLTKCLKAVKKHLPDADIAVLDTGSLDGSLRSAAAFTRNTGSFEWCDDFSKAKNACIEMARNDLVLVIDSDEYIEGFLTSGEGTGNIIGEYSEHPGAVGRIRRINSYINEQGLRVEYGEWINRLFDRRLFHFTGRIHEQVSLRNEGSGKDIYDYAMYRTGLKLFHDGYDLSPDWLKKKAERNIALLQRETEEHSEDPYLFYQLGKSYYSGKKKEEAVKSFRKALELKPNKDREYLSDLYCLTGYALLETGRAGEALELLTPLKSEKRYGSDADFLFLYAMLLMNNMRFDEARETFIACTSLPPSSTEGTNSFMAWYNAGVISEVTGDRENAIVYYKNAGEFETARKSLERLK